MFLEELKRKFLENKDRNPLLVRNLLKETVQFYILSFISQSVWAEKLLFKGGTCLRFFFDLPRLSEDLDFDIVNYQDFSIENFSEDLKNYFQKNLQFKNIFLKIAGNRRTVYLKFPILKEIGLVTKKNETDILFVRIDFAPAVGKNYQVELSVKTSRGGSILIKRYRFPDLFAGKISAILTRQAFEGKNLKERFKGRDYFDLIWFLEKKIIPNWEYLKELTDLGKKEVLKKLAIKVKKINAASLSSDLIPFFEDATFVKNFFQNFRQLYQSYKKILTGQINLAKRPMIRKNRRQLRIEKKLSMEGNFPLTIIRNYRRIE